MSKPRLLLVSMSGLRIVDPNLRAAGLRLPGVVRRVAALAQLPPLGLLTIAGTIDDQWHIDLVVDDGAGSIERTKARILSHRPDVVAFSTLTAAADRAAKLSGALRAFGITTVVGGLHATSAPSWCQERFDSVIIGDGETLFPRALLDWQNRCLAPSYRSNQPFDLGQSVRPRWDLWKQPSTPRYTVQTMRGCPWSCHFCAASRLLGPARRKPSSQIVREFRQVAEIQSRPWIELADDNTFALSNADEEAFAWLDELRSMGAKWFTESDWRISQHPKLLDRIARSGCRQILIGLESPIHTYGGMGGKTSPWNEMLAAVKTIQSAGIVVNACFIIGCDQETPTTIARLRDFLATAPFGEVQVTLQTPFPGTRMHEVMRRGGRLLSDDFSRYTLFDVVFEPAHMSPDQLRHEFLHLVSTVYSHDAQSRRARLNRHIRRRRRESL